jgi:uncharacterized membrane protein
MNRRALAAFYSVCYTRGMILQPYLQKISKEKIGLWSCIAVTGTAFVVALILLTFGYSPGVQFILKLITQSESIEDNHRFLTLMQIAALGVTLAGLIYSLGWRYITPKLPVHSPPDINRYSLSPSISVLEILFLIILLIVAITIRLHSINRSLDYDELYTLTHFVDVDSIWVTISSYRVFNNHIAYSVLTYLSKTIFGENEWVFRLPALLMGLISLCLFWYFIRTLVDKKVAALATLGLAIVPSHVEWSTSARGYTGLLLFTLISSFLYLQLLREPSYGRWSIFILASVAGIYMHLYTSLVTVVQIILVLFLALKQSSFNKTQTYLNTRSFQFIWSAFWFITVLSFICYLPVLFELISTVWQRGRGTFQLSFPITVVELLSNGNLTLTIVFFLLFVLGLVALWKLYVLEATYFLFLIVLPLSAVMLARPYFLYPRFFAYYLPFYLLLVSLGYFRLWALIIKQKINFVRYMGSIIWVLFLGYVLYFWSTNSWFNIYEASYRKATHALVADADNSVRLCAIGADPELYQFYSERQLIILTSIEEAKQLDNSSAEIRCIYRKETWEPPIQTLIANFLLENAETQQIDQFLIFWHKR